MSTKIILKNMLKEIIPYIEGRWILSDGGLLGLIRNKDLLDYDDDLDLYLYPGTIINLPDDHPTLGMCDYYMEKKIYRKNEKKFKPNPWLEYLSYLRCTPETKGMNRPQLFKYAKSRYGEEYIKPEFSQPYIDIFKLKDEGNGIFTIDFWTKFLNHHYKLDELQNPQKNTDLGYNVYLPNNPMAVLERLYGSDWRIEKKDFKYNNGMK